ncbi:MAG: hypothetical protein ACM3P1_08540 [Candidatus Saccharibacteria bacterium]
MKLFLRLKHWQLFIIWILSAILSITTSESNWWIFTFAIYDFFLIGWIYSIGKVTNKLNGKCRIENYHEDLWFIICFISIIPYGYFAHSNAPNNGFLMFGTFLLLSISALKLISFSAKSLMQNERKEHLKFADYFKEFLLIAFMVIGLWKIQPKMNKIVKLQ